jgi:hypothetical protein
MNWQTFLTPFVWILNGLLVLAYLLANHWQTVLLVPLLGYLCLRGPTEHQRWAVGISLLAVSVSLLTGAPVPAFLLAMTLAACLALFFERFNPANLHWRVLSGLALYALVGAGITLFQGYTSSLAPDNQMLTQGQNYISIMSAIGLYGVPLGYFVLLAQNVFVHPPIPGGQPPAQLVNTLRARKQD